MHLGIDASTMKHAIAQREQASLAEFERSRRPREKLEQHVGPH